MSISLADLCGEDSDSDDEEYIPDEGGASEGSHSGSGEEELADPGNGGHGPKKKRKGKTSRSRMRRGGGMLEGEGEEGSEEEDEEEAAASKEEEERKEKARIDDLWTSFKQETGSVQPRAKGKAESTVADIEADPPPKKVKIQKTYDFAGEEVTVEKEVDVDSQEAKKFLKSEPEGLLQSSTQGSTSEDVEAVVDTTNTEEARATMAHATVTQSAPGTKSLATPKVKSSGLSSVLSSIGKKQKMSTLEKSSLDWKKYKEDHGLQEELARHSKDGYLEKMDFLHRADVRQFELEREQRLKRFKKII